jgi:sulfate transport system substrate-binding protein
MQRLFANVSVLDSGARGSTTTFVENGKGDVLVAWENEAHLAMRQHPGDYEIVSPSISILAQPSVAVVDANARAHHTEPAAQAYLEYLYTDEAQRLAGQNFYRPSAPAILDEFKNQFDTAMRLVTIADFGGWDAAQQQFFADGGVFDQIYAKK